MLSDRDNSDNWSCFISQKRQGFENLISFITLRKLSFQGIDLNPLMWDTCFRQDLFHQCFFDFNFFCHYLYLSSNWLIQIPSQIPSAKKKAMMTYPTREIPVYWILSAFPAFGIKIKRVLERTIPMMK